MELNSSIEKKIQISGITGFVGQNLNTYLLRNYSVSNLDLRKDDMNINSDVVIHLAGIAHDFENKFTENDYINVNLELTKKIFEAFLKSKSTVFIFFSSIKAVAENCSEILDEKFIPDPQTFYGKSKRMAELYIINKLLDTNKRIYILRPCMIHGPKNKGNLNSLFNYTALGLPWPFGSFNSKKSFCSIENLCFVIDNLIRNNKIESGIYNICDSETLTLNEIVKLMYKYNGKVFMNLKLPKYFWTLICTICDYFGFSFYTKKINKLIENFEVSNKKFLNAINSSLPHTAKEGLITTLDYFKEEKSRP